MAQKTHFTVARNAAYTAASVEGRERHNERKNETYYNADIVTERIALNVRFHQNLSPNDTLETYAQTFNRLIENGTVVKRGLKADAKVIDELVFDVNTAYFNENGGYDFAKKFYESAYQFAVKEVGVDEYILSAVMHADEKNAALSEQLGCDVYHYLNILNTGGTNSITRIFDQPDKAVVFSVSPLYVDKHPKTFLELKFGKIVACELIFKSFCHLTKPHIMKLHNRTFYYHRTKSLKNRHPTSLTNKTSRRLI